MSRESFKGSIFRIVEYLTKHAISDSAKKLIVHYFNESRANTAKLKAIEAITKYYPESLSSIENPDHKLIQYLEKMEIESKKWDSE